MLTWKIKTVAVPIIPFYLWLIKAPFPTGAVILGVIIIHGILQLRDWIKRKKRKANLTAEATRLNH